MNQSDRTRITSTTWLEGWRLLAVVSSMLLLAAAAIFAMSPDSLGARMVIRMTARTSLVLFCLTWTASAAARFWPGGWSLWQRRNRRMLGLAFAVSHSIHACAIASFARLDPVAFHAATNVMSEITGGMAYLFIYAMAATSFDRTAAWLGPRLWATLHTWGAYYIWASFVVTFGKRLGDGPVYPLALLLLGFVVLMRVAARFSARVTAA